MFWIIFCRFLEFEIVLTTNDTSCKKIFVKQALCGISERYDQIIIM